ncbi:hypothetical protein BAE44_0008699 [Dichanthelium oligosanthes]|uniref:High chlorophyll fluorescence 153 n=1 Tax=Dichanthelium oligosanthes TaxID=888268 RepID=A0A1E5VYS2_9POAL|nr:hypothetical protein BAE44_0008699 [Dichanthelium oligosanthes]
MARGLVAALSLAARFGASATPSYTGQPVRANARPVGGRARRRGLMVVRAGGPPSTNALILAFVLPLSLFVGTLVTAARVADDLDERFLREMEINKAIMEEDESFDEEDEEREYDEGEEEEEDEEQAPVEEKEPVVVGAAAATPTRARNRPRRQV